jgi:soluble lytic murein transglycosylase-like protein
LWAQFCTAEATINRVAIVVLLTALFGYSRAVEPIDLSRNDSPVRYEFSWEEAAYVREEPRSYPNVANILDGPKPMLSLYREDLTHDHVEEFFVDLTGSEDIALTILYHADRNDLSLALVFSLSWVESRFEPTAVNHNDTSIDRGLFQLNNRSFPHLSEPDFFDPDVNADHGTDYLRYALRHGRDEETALAVYNAGLSRVRRQQIPASTLVYIDRIMRYKASLERHFIRHIRTNFPMPDDSMRVGGLSNGSRS